ncbi:vomeronasal type-2 receptor 26-like [Aquarana catesbeiana]|uniref:vomeronasal type-2 receptor 26-like n=1 Tax=Aquarana catesbeiana TaxID=8400 RepID=UPI003CC9BF4D
MGQFLRIRRNCIKLKQFKREADSLYGHFRESGYSHKTLRRAKKRAYNTERDELLQMGDTSRVNKVKKGNNQIEKRWIFELDILFPNGMNHESNFEIFLEEYISPITPELTVTSATNVLMTSGQMKENILTLFILFCDTPIVKANNQTVSFILLTSILLSFLCVFLFLGRPVDITCMLRQMSFGIFFSIAVSFVLAITIRVCIAFKATKPGSYWRKWVEEKTSNSVVIICFSVQGLIWLSASPPYQEYDMDSYPRKIIIQCNEGSGIGFYSVLGYMWFLVAVSFVLAFMVRTLLDRFNEAKYITFGMLVFCSVWIALIPI